MTTPTLPSLPTAHAEAPEVRGSELRCSGGFGSDDRPNTEVDECDVICPHCGESYQAEGEDFSETEREETCDHCGGRYILHDEFTVTHHTRALPNYTGETQRPETNL